MTLCWDGNPDRRPSAATLSQLGETRWCRASKRGAAEVATADRGSLPLNSLTFVNRVHRLDSLDGVSCATLDSSNHLWLGGYCALSDSYATDKSPPVPGIDRDPTDRDFRPQCAIVVVSLKQSGDSRGLSGHIRHTRSLPTQMCAVKLPPSFEGQPQTTGDLVNVICNEWKLFVFCLCQSDLSCILQHPLAACVSSVKLACPDSTASPDPILFALGDAKTISRQPERSDEAARRTLVYRLLVSHSPGTVLLLTVCVSMGTSAAGLSAVPSEACINQVSVVSLSKGDILHTGLSVPTRVGSTHIWLGLCNARLSCYEYRPPNPALTRLHKAYEATATEKSPVLRLQRTWSAAKELSSVWTQTLPSVVCMAATAAGRSAVVADPLHQKQDACVWSLLAPGSVLLCWSAESYGCLQCIDLNSISPLSTSTSRRVSTSVNLLPTIKNYAMTWLSACRLAVHQPNGIILIVTTPDPRNTLAQQASLHCRHYAVNLHSTGTAANSHPRFLFVPPTGNSQEQQEPTVELRPWWSLARGYRSPLKRLSTRLPAVIEEAKDKFYLISLVYDRFIFP